MIISPSLPLNVITATRVNADANQLVFRITFKLTTGRGNPHVAAMLISVRRSSRL